MTATTTKFVPAGVSILVRKLDASAWVKHTTTKRTDVPADAVAATVPGLSNCTEFAAAGYAVIVHNSKVREEQDTPDVFNLCDDDGVAQDDDADDTVIETPPAPVAAVAAREKSKCRRCNGRGELPGYRHVQGGVCFGCGGAGVR